MNEQVKKPVIGGRNEADKGKTREKEGGEGGGGGGEDQ